MELNHFTKSKMESKKEELSVAVNMHSSNVIFNINAIEHLGLKIGDRIVFGSDSETGDWFFYRTDDDDSFKLRKYAGSKMLAFHCKNLCKKIANSIEKGAYKISMSIDKVGLPFKNLLLHRVAVQNIELDDFYDILNEGTTVPVNEVQASEAPVYEPVADPASQVRQTDNSPMPFAY